MLSLTRKFLVATLIALSSGCDSDLTGRHAAALLRDIQVRGSVEKKSLGFKLTLGEGQGSAFLTITNQGKEPLNVGNDVVFWVEGGRFETALLVKGKDRSDQQDRLLAYAYDARILSSVEGNKVVRFLLGPSGQAFSVDESGFKDYAGNWPDEVTAQSKATIAQQLATWPGAEQGWAASPVLSVGNQGDRFRIVVPLGDKAEAHPIILALTATRLSQFLSDKSQPLCVRCWAAVWLVSLSTDAGWKAAAPIAIDQGAEPEVRQALLKSLATQAPAEALQAVDKVLWDFTASKELRLQAYYALTWSPHSAAKELLKKATEHSDAELAAAATKWLANEP